MEGGAADGDRLLNGFIVEQGRKLVPHSVEAPTAMIKTITEKEQTGRGSESPRRCSTHSFDHAAIAALPQYFGLRYCHCDAGMKDEIIRGCDSGFGDRGYTHYAADGKYSACLTLEQARDHGVLVYELDGAPLPDTKGGPFRLVTPGLGDLCANVKGVSRIEITKGPDRDTRQTTCPPVS